MNWLVDQDGQRWRLERPLVIGRAPQCDIAIRSGVISRRHCLVSPEGDACRVEDLGSSSGTWLDQRQRHGGLLRVGMTLNLSGRHHFHLEPARRLWVVSEHQRLAVHGTHTFAGASLVREGDEVSISTEHGKRAMVPGQTVGGVTLVEGDTFPPPADAQLDVLWPQPGAVGLGASLELESLRLDWVGAHYFFHSHGQGFVNGLKTRGTAVTDGAVLATNEVTARLRLSPRLEASDPRLEATIAAAPGDAARWLVYGDLLEERGDLSHHRVRQGAPRTWEEDRGWCAELGELAAEGVLDVDWEHGHARRLVLHGGQFPAGSIAGLFSRLFKWRGARFLRTLDLDLTDAVSPLPAWLERLSEASVPKTLERLTFGRTLAVNTGGTSRSQVRELLGRLSLRAPRLSREADDVYPAEPPRTATLVPTNRASAPITLRVGGTTFLPDTAARRTALDFNGRLVTLRVVGGAPVPRVNGVLSRLQGAPRTFEGRDETAIAQPLRHLTQMWLGDESFRLLID